MKKLTALLLALIMVFSLAMVASADETGGQDEGTQAPTYTDMSTVTITKWYKNPNNQVSPAETLKFTIERDGVTNAGVINAETGAVVTKDNMPVPTIADISFAEGDAGKVVIANGTADYKCKRDIVVTLPTYNAVGIYTYIIKEVEGDTAGVTYYTDDIKLVVTVIEQDGKIRVAAVHTEEAGTKKNDEFSNIYEAGELNVNKQVTGNLGDREKEFTMTVTFVAPEGDSVKAPIYYTDSSIERTITPEQWTDGKATAEIILKHDETVTFTNIPYGVTYSVIENDYTTEAAGAYDAPAYTYGNTSDPNGSNTINYDPIQMPILANLDNKIDDIADNVVVTNNKEAEVDTGIALDSMPFVLMLAVAVIGMGAIVIGKKRYEV